MGGGGGGGLQGSFILEYCYRYSWAARFWDVLKELHDLAGQHEVIAENTQGQVMKDVQSLIVEMKQQRRKVEIRDFTSELMYETT